MFYFYLINKGAILFGLVKYFQLAWLISFEILRNFSHPKEEEEGTPIICPYPALLPCSYGGGRWVLDFGEWGGLYRRWVWLQGEYCTWHGVKMAMMLWRVMVVDMGMSGVGLSRWWIHKGIFFFFGWEMNIEGWERVFSWEISWEIRLPTTPFFLIQIWRKKIQFFFKFYQFTFSNILFNIFFFFYPIYYGFFTISLFFPKCHIFQKVMF